MTTQENANQNSNTVCAGEIHLTFHMGSYIEKRQTIISTRDALRIAANIGKLTPHSTSNPLEDAISPEIFIRAIDSTKRNSGVEEHDPEKGFFNKILQHFKQDENEQENLDNAIADVLENAHEHLCEKGDVYPPKTPISITIETVKNKPSIVIAKRKLTLASREHVSSRRNDWTKEQQVIIRKAISNIIPESRQMENKNLVPRWTSEGGNPFSTKDLSKTDYEIMRNGSQEISLKTTDLLPKIVEIRDEISSICETEKKENFASEFMTGLTRSLSENISSTYLTIYLSKL